MAIFDNIIAAAERLIERYGEAVTWTQLTNGAPADPAQPWKPATTETDTYNTTIVFLPEDRVKNEMLMLLAKTEVPAGKLMGYMAPGAFTPAVKDTVTRGDGSHVVVDTIDTLAPNGTPILYILGFSL